MGSKWFISAFGEIEQVQTGNEVAHDLRKVGNLFESREEARRVLFVIKKAIGDYEKELHGVRK